MARKLLLFALAFAVFLAGSGCSELRIIGKSALREVSSDATNVERASYQQPVFPEAAGKTTVAQANAPPTPVKKAARKKGLWENL